MVRVRFQRVGKKNEPHYRLVAVNRTVSVKGAPLEVLGYYNPRAESNKLQVKAERLSYWLKNGAQLSEKANVLLKKMGAVG